MDFLTREIGENRPENKASEYQECGLENESHEAANEESDLQPEYCRYRDEGCKYATSCLACPFPQCLYEEPHGRQQWLKGMRNREIDRLFSEGWKISEIATLFGVSRRTIQRAIKGVIERNK
jgi:AraC-like DNA-binding protein